MHARKMFEVAIAGMLRTRPWSAFWLAYFSSACGFGLRSDGSASLHHRLSKSAATLLIVARLSESRIHGAERRVTLGAPRLGESCDTFQMRLQPNSDTALYWGATGDKTLLASTTYTSSKCYGPVSPNQSYGCVSVSITRSLAQPLAATELKPSTGCDREQHQRQVSLNARSVIWSSN